MTFLVSSQVDTPFGTFPGVWSGAKSAAKYINKAKKLKINIITCNNKATPAGSQICAKQAVDSKVTAYIGSDPFLATGIGVSDLKAANIPFSLFATGADDYNGTRSNEFPLTGAGFSPSFGLGTIAKKIGAKKLGIICTDFPGFQLTCDNLRAVAEKNGVDVVAEVSVALTATTFTSQVQKLKSAGADAVGVLTVGSAAAPIAQAANSIGYKPKWLATRAAFADNAAFSTFAKAGGNVWGNSSLPPIEAAKSYPGLKQFASQNKGINIKNQDEAAITTWAAVYGYAQIAAKIKGPITSAKMLAAVKKAKNVKIGKGLLTWSPGKKGKAPYPRLASDLMYYGQIKNGKYIPNPKKPISASAGATLK